MFKKKKSDSEIRIRKIKSSYIFEIAVSLILLLTPVKAIFIRNNCKYFLITFLLLLGLSSFYSTSPVSHAYQVAPTSSTLPSKPVNITLTSTQILRVNTPAGSNVTLLSVRGGQYDIGLFSSGGKNALLFTPLQNSNYSLILNVSSVGQDYAQLAILGSPTNSWTKNISSTGNLIVDIVLSVVPPPTAAQNSGWNPLFGFTGISLGGITIDATDVLIIFALFSIALIGLGMKYSQKMLYGGIFFLSLLGMIAIGILVVGLILGAYIAGFAVIRSVVGFRARRSK